jgi:hypothetical protein
MMGGEIASNRPSDEICFSPKLGDCTIFVIEGFTVGEQQISFEGSMEPNPG